MSDLSHNEEDRLEELLERCDEALAAGSEPEFPADLDSPPELKSRLELDLASIRLLRQHLSPHPPAVHSASPDRGLALSHVARFRLIRELGRGGSGIVYLAEDPQLGRDVALKIPRPEVLAYPGSRERFVREAQAAGALDHPNLVPVYEAGEHPPLCFIATAFCPGPTLALWLKDRGDPLPPVEAARFVSILADAVQHAHGRGILHRDLKPANILLDSENKNFSAENHRTASQSADPPSPSAGFALLAHPRITDFGLAKLLEEDSDATASGVILGTPCYMAPEQAAGDSRHLSVAVDIYALGAILYETLTLRPPFRDTSRLLTLEQVRSVMPAPPRSLQPRIPRDLETICLKCLEKDPARRYPTASTLADDLRRFLRGEPIQAMPSPWWQRAGKWMRRRPFAAAALGSGAVATIALVAVWLSFTVQLQRQRDAAARSDQTAREERARAIANQNQALEAVDRFLARVGDRRLADIPEMDEVRRELLEDALGFCEQFLKQSASPDPIVRFQTGRTHSRMARILHSLSQFEPAEKSYRTAAALLEQLAAEFPAEREYRLHLAKNYYSLSLLCREAKRGKDAEPCFLRALELQRQLVDEDPLSREFRRDQATTIVGLASIRRGQARTEEAEADLKAAVQMLEGLCREQPSDREVQVALSRAYASMGHQLFDTQRVAQAEHWFRLAADRMATLLESHPGSTADRINFANALNSVGVACELLNRPAEAVAAYQKCINEKMKIADKHPTVPGHRFSVAWSQTNLGGICLKAGKLPDAEAAFRAARETLDRMASETPGNDDVIAQLAKNDQGFAELHHKRGSLDDAETSYRSAAQRLEKLLALRPDHPPYAADLALAWASLGNVRVDKGDPQDSLPWFERALDLLAKTLKKHPRDTMALEFTHEARLGRALALSALARYAQARDDWSAVVPHRRDSHTTNHHTAWRILDYATEGRYRQALSELQSLEKLAAAKADDPLLLYRLAQSYALISAGRAADRQQPHSLSPEDRKHCALRALQILEILRKQAYFEPQSRREVFLNDQAFELLRSQPEFNMFRKSLALSR